MLIIVIINVIIVVLRHKCNILLKNEELIDSAWIPWLFESNEVRLSNVKLKSIGTLPGGADVLHLTEAVGSTL